MENIESFEIFLLLWMGSLKINQLFDRHMMKLPLYHTNLILAAHNLIFKSTSGRPTIFGMKHSKNQNH
jgi:hypothetical protein